MWRGWKLFGGHKGRRKAFLWYFLELKGVALGTAGWLTMGPAHMAAATQGAFEQHDRSLVRLKVSLGAGGALSREGPCGRGQVGFKARLLVPPFLRIALGL